MVTIYRRQDLEGSGGKGGKGGSGAKDDQNSLRANSTAQVLMLVGEGPTRGVKGGLKGLILDDTHVMNASGEIAIPGVTMHERLGFPTQDPIPGFDEVSTEINVGVTVTFASPVVRSLTDSDYTSVVVSVMIPALVHQTDKGLKRTSVSFQIEVQYNGGPWVNTLGLITIEGKNTSPYVEQYRLPLPRNPSGNSHPWNVRVIRSTPDSDNEKLQNDVVFQSMTALIDVTLQYPDSALLGLMFDAKLFDNSSIPNVEAIYEGMEMLVPTNYDPETHTYTGLWDGNFKMEFANDPAWFYYNVAINRRYGIGRFLDSTAVDKWTLYQISQVCNEMVSDGYGGFEPRFELNAFLTEDTEVYEMFQLIASAFRGMSYWASGSVTASQDVLSDPKVLVTRASVIGSEFNYSSSAIIARHTVIHVKYKDKRDDYRPAVEVVRSPEGMRRYGERIKEIEAFGCTSRAAANRLGRWILYTELNELQAVAYQAGMDHSTRRPGDIVNIMDPEASNVDYGGRLTSGSTTTVLQIDREIYFDPGKTFTIWVTLPDGTLHESATTTTGNSKIVTLTTALAAAPIPGSNFIVSSNTVEPKQFRLISILERDKSSFDVTALEVYTPKYSLIDAMAPLDPPLTRDPNAPAPPSDLTAKEVFFYDNGVPKTQLLFSWKMPATMIAPLFHVEIDTPDSPNEVRLQGFAGLSTSIDNTVAGDYTIRVYSVSLNGRYRSLASTLTFAADGIGAAPTLTVENVSIVGETGAIFYARDVELEWSVQAPEHTGATQLMYQQTNVKIYDVTNPLDHVLLRDTFTTALRFKYTFQMNNADSSGNPTRNLLFVLSAQDTAGHWGVTTSFEATNPAPDVPTVTITGAIKMAFFETEFPQIKDIRGQKIHVSTISGFTPGPANMVYDGPNSMATVPLTSGSYFAKVGLYDDFDPIPSAYTAAIGFTVVEVSIDTDAPAIPAGLTSSTLILGNGMARVTFTWTANTEDDLAGYDIQIKEGAGNFIGFTTATNTYFVDVMPGTALQAKLAAFDQVGNKSDFSGTYSTTAATDTTAPAAPTGMVTATGLDAIWLRWNANTEIDLKHYIIYEGTSASTGTMSAIGTTPATAFPRTGLALGTQRYYALKAVDTSGNISDFSAVVSATTGTLAAAYQYTFTGPFFTPNTPVNTLSWGAGSVAYNGGGTLATRSISAGSVAWTAGTIYVYYVRGDTVLSTTQSLSAMYSAGGEILGIYKGGTNFQLASGAAMINGNTIIAQTIGASQLVADQAIITGSIQIANAVITNAHVTSLSAAKLEAGTAMANSITVSGRTLGAIANTDVLFENMSDNWTSVQVGSPGPHYYGNGATNTVTGTRSLVFNGGAENWMVSPHKVPFDPSKLYRVTFRVRRSILNTDAPFYLGVVGFGEDGVTKVNATGADTYASSHYAVATNVAGSTLTNSLADYVGYIKGHAATGTSSGTLTTPAKMHSNVRYLCPIAIFNYGLSSGGGVYVLDSVKIEQVTDEAAAVVNAGTTLIEPGKILISGATTLSSWRNGGDNTKIEGGALAANTVAANSMKIGLRGLQIADLGFGVNKTTNTISWASGVINYINDAGANTYVSVTAGSRVINGWCSIYWVKGATTLSYADDSNGGWLTPQGNDNAVVLATYIGGAVLNVTYGGTIIDGSRIVTGTITTNQLAAGSITTSLLAAGAVTATTIAAGAITAAKLAIGSAANMFVNSEFENGMNYWGYLSSSNASLFQLNLRTDQYAPLPAALEIRQPNTTSGNYYDICQKKADGTDKLFAVQPSKYYELSTYYFGHRCVGVEPYIQWLDFNGNHVSYQNFGGIYGAAQNTVPNKSLAAYQRFWAKMQAPVNAVYCRVFFRSHGVQAGQTDGYLWLTRMFFGEANPNQTEATPWSPSGMTLINGTSIITNTIVAAHIQAGQINATHIAANTITATHITAAKINATQILQNGTTITDLIAANAVTQGAAAFNAGAAGVGAGGAVVAITVSISNPTGAPITIIADCIGYAAVTASSGSGSKSSTTTATLYRNGVGLRSRSVTASATSTGSQAVSANNSEFFSMSYADDAPGAGTITYDMYLIANTANAFQTNQLQQMFLSALVRKR